MSSRTNRPRAVLGYTIDEAYKVKKTMPESGGLVDLEYGGYAIPLARNLKMEPPSRTVPIHARVPRGVVALLPGNVHGFWRLVSIVSTDKRAIRNLNAKHAKSAAQLQREIDEDMNRRAIEGVRESEAAARERLEDG